MRTMLNQKKNRTLLPLMLNIILICSLYNSSNAQLSRTNPQYKRANSWCFGTKVGLDFNTNPPAYFSSLTFNSIEGTSSISNSAGSLQFYSDGYNVLNSKHELVKNGEKLFGFASSSQAVLIVNHSGNDSMFYIFTTPRADFEDTGLRLSVLNKNIQNGKGEVTLKNKIILPKSTERLTSVNHQNGKDIWIIAHGYTSNSYFSFLLTKEGLIERPTESKVGNILDVPVTAYSSNSPGYLRANIQGNLFASALFGSKRIELFSLDAGSGKLEFSNSLIINKNPYGLAFSNNSNNLFLQSENNDTSFLSYYNFENKSWNHIAKYNNYQIHALQNTPNGNIALALVGSDSIGLISNVDDIPKLGKLQVSTSPSYTNHGLPNFNQSYFNHPSIDFFYTMDCNENSIAFEGKDSFYATEYKWYFKNTKTNAIDSQLIEEPNYVFKDTGDYLVTYIASKTGRSDTIVKTIKFYPSITKDFLGNDTFYCKEDAFSHTLKMPERLHSFHWGRATEEGIIPFTQENTLILDTAGIYTSTIVTKNFCILRDTLTVVEHLPTIPTIKHDWDSLYSEQVFATYQWYRDGQVIVGETEDRMGMNSTGNYELLGTDVYGCSARSKVKFIGALSTKEIDPDQISVYPNPLEKVLHIDFKQKGEHTIKLLNALGQVVAIKTEHSQSSLLNTEQLSKGVYVLIITKNRNTLFTKKIIKH